MERFYPELAQFKSRRERHRALGQAKRTTLWRSWRSWLYYGLGVVMATVGPFVLPYLDVPLRWRSRARLGLLLGFIASLALVDLSNRHRIGRDLRQQLANRGQPVCVPYGYNLTGNTSGVCPECGTKITA